jgi:hypothetical protein
MFGGDHPVGGEQAVLDIGEHGVRPAEGRVACSSAIGAGDVAFMDDTPRSEFVADSLLKDDPISLASATAG